MFIDEGHLSTNQLLLYYPDYSISSAGRMQPDPKPLQESEWALLEKYRTDTLAGNAEPPVPKYQERVQQLLNSQVGIQERAALDKTLSRWRIGVDNLWFDLHDQYRNRSILRPLSKLAAAVPHEKGTGLLLAAYTERNEGNHASRLCQVKLSQADVQRALEMADARRSRQSNADMPELNVQVPSSVKKRKIAFAEEDHQDPPVANSCAHFKPKKYPNSPSATGTEGSDDDLIIDEARSTARPPATKRQDGPRSLLPHAQLVQNARLTDTTINELCSIFNPDPTVWYIADSHVVSLESHTGIAVGRTMLRSEHAKILLPIHDPEMSHWSLGFIDCINKSIIVYDSLHGLGHRPRLVRAMKKFATSHQLNITDFEVKADPYPATRQGNGVDCGVYLLAWAISVLHENPMERILPSIWRSQLAALFETTLEEPFTRKCYKMTLSHATEITDVAQAITNLQSIQKQVQQAHIALEQYNAILNIARRQRQISEEQTIDCKDAVQERQSLQITRPVGQRIKHWVQQKTTELNDIIRASRMASSSLPRLALLCQSVERSIACARSNVAMLERSKSELKSKATGQIDTEITRLKELKLTVERF